MNNIISTWLVEIIVRVVCTVATLFVAGYYGAFTLVATLRLRRIESDNPALLQSDPLKKARLSTGLFAAAMLMLAVLYMCRVSLDVIAGISLGVLALTSLIKRPLLSKKDLESLKPNN
ncbi:MAG: hypothetical protein LBK75_08445 [Oscillospiraceae bacterium]|nr:hypothetical protein [Oscillospiraceae bacterium]